MLCTLTAALLALLAVAVMITRHQVLGDEVPAGPNTWKVTMTVHGTSQGDAKILTAAPLDVGRQHVQREEYGSAQLRHKAPDVHRPERRPVLWSRRAGVADGPFSARCEYQVSLEVLHPSSSMSRLARGLYAPPRPREYLDPGSRAGADSERISAKARQLTAGLENKADVAEALYRYVADEVRNEPSLDGQAANAADCLKNESGDSGAKSRLLAALLRNRDVPARVVTGVTLTRGHEQHELRAHYWVEAWVRDHWWSLCPFHRHFKTVPSTYLVFAYGDQPMVKGRHVKDLDYAFLVERVAPGFDTSALSPVRRAFLCTSLHLLPPAEQRLVEFLLLLPVAALIICVFRNLIGLNSFGTFAPALVGLAFRDLHSLPGILVFVSILLIGWVMRRLLNYYHLLQVPRIALMLSLIVVVLIVAIVTANSHDLPATKYISLFPMIILTGMVERFWTLETEDSTTASFKTLFTTMLISATIALVLSLSPLADLLFRYPETLGLIMAAQLLIGRYTGYRFMELLRFRDFLTPPPSDPPSGFVPSLRRA
jgi:hypothetical protein